MESYPLIRTPQSQGYTWATKEQWREQVRQERKCCENCGALASDLHEGIVTRRDVQGMPNDKRLLAFSDCNMWLLCLQCHHKFHGYKDAREFFWELSCNKYGESDMREWYKSFEWKTPDRRFMPE